ncbi:ABC transporter ATP-binding protein [Arthrobacter castelli]|uniref:ABC transporter ATP-binding protein n=1 Tax=Arthrobacter castelli TaxID=271431 RepID=UPI0004055290|nr:ABC transporter ATP-binding protein [Arthrobacter castelli]
MAAVIETDKLTKTYGKNRGIVDVDLQVDSGEIFGFLGPNGAGKTTTIRTLLGFQRPASGTASVFGLDSRRDSVQIRSRVGNLPGEFTLEDRMTGEAMLRYFARLRGVESLDYARHLAGRLGADLKRPMRRLSRGNKQKVGLVLAMFHRPELLILDEPTGGLDPLVREEFLALIAEVRDEGRTVFFSSHVLGEVERICDRIAVIRGGRLAAVEPTSEIINKSFRHVRIAFARQLKNKEMRKFAALAGVDNFDHDSNSLSFTLYGNYDDVVKLAARHTVVDIDFERPPLEEIFMTYYADPQERGMP